MGEGLNNELIWYLKNVDAFHYDGKSYIQIFVSLCLIQLDTG